MDTKQVLTFAAGLAVGYFLCKQMKPKAATTTASSEPAPAPAPSPAQMDDATKYCTEQFATVRFESQEAADAAWAACMAQATATPSTNTPA
jgi:hypothetical protein